MKTSLAAGISLALFVAACAPSPDRANQNQAFVEELRAQREAMDRLKSEITAERQRLHRTAQIIQSRLEDLDSSLKQASAEIWGNGSPTSARLATAQGNLTAIRADVDDLVAALRGSRRLDASSRGPAR